MFQYLRAQPRMANNESRKKIRLHQENVPLSIVLFSSFRHRSQISNFNIASTSHSRACCS